ncbi:MAG: thiamine-phosphate kinase [Bacteroidetes bacterium]|nr:thiamine-phosphate kinase [Bacteroidota bacterium]
MSKTPVSALGEFGLIEKISEWVTLKDSDVLKSIGDDAAVFHPAEGMEQLISTDCLVEGIHFDLTYQSLRHLGYKSVAVNVSDIYAMNGTPQYITLALALPQKITVELLEEFYAGVHLACKDFHVAVIGGDLSASSGNMFISVTVTGFANRDEIVYRNGAKPGDLIVVSGNPGRSFAGLKVLIREKEFYLSDPENFAPTLDRHSWVIERHLAPKPRTEVLSWLNQKRVKPTAMIDLSDGLAGDLFHICKQSGVGAVLDELSLPVTEPIRSVAEQFDEESTKWALFGGEDYELLFTVNPEWRLIIESNDELTIIGEITDQTETMLLREAEGDETEIEKQGWNHFN